MITAPTNPTACGRGVVQRRRAAEPSHASCFAPHFVVLSRHAGPRAPIEAAESVAQATRRALMSHADEPIAALLSGHDKGGGALQANHLAVVPLPRVGGSHGNGELLGVALIPPAGLVLDELEPLYRSLTRWEAAHGEGDRARRLRLVLGRQGVWTLARRVDQPSLCDLREDTWTVAARDWASVTPVVLDRHPGSLRRDRQRAVRRANATIAAACERIGLPAPVEIELSISPFFRGSSPAGRWCRRASKAKDPRPQLHVRLRFAHPVSGPVLLGAARYHGLGLFRPWRGSEA